MKQIILVVSLLASIHLKAQTVGSINIPKHQFETTSETDIRLYLKQTIQELQDENMELKLDYYKSTPVSKHYTYSILYKQIPLWNACVKLNLDHQGNILSIKKELPSASQFSNSNIDEETMQWNRINQLDYIKHYWSNVDDVKKIDLRIYTIQEASHVVGVASLWNMHEDKTLVLDMDGNKLAEYDNARHLRIDTTVQAYVFNPDPLTFLNQVYGGIYIDDNDLNSSWFTPAYVTVTLPAQFETSNNTFYLENSWVKIDSFSAPNISPASSTTPYFFYSRDQSGFEDCNAMYHINTFHNYISSLGYDTLMDGGIRVDTHGLSGQDNSVFIKNGGNPTLTMGTGGVDDAEDADVIIHEYCHGISWSANNNGVLSFERSGLDEGLADYFATSYSRSINPYHWESVFSWDGHNTFWPGRVANTTINYPVGGNNYYTLGEVWNSAMSSIWTDLGQVVTDKLMLESLHYFTDNTTLPEAAFYVLQSDTVLFNGIHTPTLCSHFQAKNILNSNCHPDAVQDVLEKQTIRLINSYGFATANQEALVEFSIASSGSYFLYDITGNLVKHVPFTNTKNISISPTLLTSGVYIVRVETNEGSKQFKLNKI